jgi:deoxyribodipyrimidine photo-lyase
MLSPYLRHRLLLEEEVLQTTLQRHSLAAASKFVQEVFWRTYYKGWLEQRPAVWADYRHSLVRILSELEDRADVRQRYESAVAGNTGIDCFDAWVHELLSTGYLHNHARMWFASIWVFTLELPWQLGADFFYRHLLDGDPASNTLSWRWVSGLHTPGKTYLATAANIAKFTDNRFHPEGLAAHAPAPKMPKVYPLEPLPASQWLQASERFGLFVTEEDCFPESILGAHAPAVVIGATATRLRSPLPVGGLAEEFAGGAVGDAVKRTSRLLGRYAPRMGKATPLENDRDCARSGRPRCGVAYRSRQLSSPAWHLAACAPRIFQAQRSDTCVARANRRRYCRG